MARIKIDLTPYIQEEIQSKKDPLLAAKNINRVIRISRIAEKMLNDDEEEGYVSERDLADLIIDMNWNTAVQTVSDSTRQIIQNWVDKLIDDVCNLYENDVYGTKGTTLPS